MTTGEDDLIINAGHKASLVQRVTSFVLTLVWWALWIYLCLPALAFVSVAVSGEQLLPYHVDTSNRQHYLDLLLNYALVIVLFGGALVLWSRINLWRFAGVERRKPVPSVSLTDLAADVGISVEELARARESQVMVVYHGKEGGIAEIHPSIPLETVAPATTTTEPSLSPVSSAKILPINGH